MTQEEYEEMIRKSTEDSLSTAAKNNPLLSAAISIAKQKESEPAQAPAAQPAQVPEIETTGVNPIVQQALDEKQKQDAAQRAANAEQARQQMQRKLNPTTQDFHNNTPTSPQEPAPTQTPVDADTQYMNDLHNANEQRAQLFSDYINDVAKRQKQEEDEMARQEKADMWSTMGTGATEVAAGIINMLGVGQLNASNQVYHSYSQDWMKQADQNIREHRKRRENMRDTLDRLNLQMQELKSAQSIEELRTQHQLQKEKEARGKQERAEARQDRAEAFQREQFEWQKQKYEQDAEARRASQERQDRATEASIAQGWAGIRDARQAQEMNMRLYGYIPDKNAPGGYRYDPTEAAKGASGSGSSNLVAYPIIDANGNINVAELKTHEMETVLLNAREAIKGDLGEDESKEFEREFRRAGDDKARNAVLLKWMGRSRTCGDMIRAIDANYKGQHGIGGSTPAPPVAAPASPSAPADTTRVNVNPRTGLHYQ